MATSPYTKKEVLTTKGASPYGGQPTVKFNGAPAYNAPAPASVNRSAAPAPKASAAPDAPNTPASTGGGGGGGFTASASSAAVDPDAALRNLLKGNLSRRGGDIDAIYQALFGDLDNLVRSRDTELESEYGGQLDKATDSYADAIPEIENSYAAIGAADSTDRSDAKDKAKEGFEETTQTIGANKQKDKAALGQYGNEQRAKFTADRDAAKRLVQSANDTTDVDALRGASNDLEGNLSQTGVTRATLGTDGAARQAVTSLTGDNGRADAAINALDSIIKSSMSGSVKEAAVKAVTDAGGLSDEDKKKVQATYGNVYSEQQAL